MVYNGRASASDEMLLASNIRKAGDKYIIHLIWFRIFFVYVRNRKPI